MQLYYAARRGDVKRVRELVGRSDQSSKNDALIEAARSSRTSAEVLRIFIESGADIFAEIECGFNSFENALGAGNLEKVKLLVEAGCNPFAVDEYQYTPLHYANSFEVVQYLLDLGADPNKQNRFGDTPLVSNLRLNHLDTARLLITHSDRSIPTHWSPLKRAIALSSPEELEKALDQCAMPQTNPEAWDLVELCSQIGNTEIADILLEHGLPWNVKNHVQSTALHIAAMCDCADMVRWLVEHGFDVNVQDEFSGTPLHDAGTSGRAAAVLIELGAQVDAENDVRDTPLTDATTIEMAELLLDNGARIDYISGQGYSILMSACEAGAVDLVRCLLERGADPDTNNCGQTALHFAARSNEPEIIQMLLDAGANPNQQTCDDYTPLMGVDTPECARLLFAAGADPCLSDMVGETVFDIWDDPEMIELLQGYERPPELGFRISYPPE